MSVLRACVCVGIVASLVLVPASSALGADELVAVFGRYDGSAIGSKPGAQPFAVTVYLGQGAGGKVEVTCVTPDLPIPVSVQGMPRTVAGGWDIPLSASIEALALPVLEEIVEYSTQRGAETLSIPATALLGAALAGTGSLDRGFAILQRSAHRLRDDERVWAHVNAVYILGELHATVARHESDLGIGVALRNPRFLLGTAPFAERRAYRYLEEAAACCDATGATGLAGQCWLSIAELRQARGHLAEATRCFQRAAERFASCGAQGFASRTNSELAEVLQARA